MAASLPPSTTSSLSTSSTRSALFGPLTTTFTLPSNCNLLVASTEPSKPLPNNAFRGRYCSPRFPYVGTAIGEDYRCWPSATSSGALRTDPFLAGGFYSPGLICPAGYAEACRVVQTGPTPTPSSETGTANGKAEWQFDFALKVSETAVGCCPRYGHSSPSAVSYRIDLLTATSTRSSFSCVLGATRIGNSGGGPNAGNGTDVSFQVCEQLVTSPLSVFGCGPSGPGPVTLLATTLDENETLSSGSCNSFRAIRKMGDSYNSKILKTDSTVKITAPMFQLVHQSSDLTAPMSTSNPSVTPGVNSPTSSFSTLSADSDTKLSTAAKAGLGVGVSIGVIALILAATVYISRRRGRQGKVVLEEQTTFEKPELEQPEKPLAVELEQPYLGELDSRSVPAELAGDVPQVR